MEEQKRRDSGMAGDDAGLVTPQSLPSSVHAALSSDPRASADVRSAPTVVTNVVRPVVSAPIAIASKPLEGVVAPGAPTYDGNTKLLIAGGGSAGTGTIAGGGYFSTSSPKPVGGQGGLVTSLVLGEALRNPPAVQLITSPQPFGSPTPGTGVANNSTVPLLQPQLLPFTPPSCGKQVTQVQYILPTLPALANLNGPTAQPQQPAGVLALPTASPTHISLANRVSPGVGPGIRYASAPTLGGGNPGGRGKLE